MSATAERMIEADAAPYDLTRAWPSLLADYSKRLVNGEAVAREVIVRECARMGGEFGGVHDRESAERALRAIYRQLHPGASPASLRAPTQAEIEATTKLDIHFGGNRDVVKFAKSAMYIRDFLTILDREERAAKEAEEANKKRRADEELERLEAEVETDDAADMRAISDGIRAANRLAEIVALMRATMRGLDARKRCQDRRAAAQRAAEIAGEKEGPRFAPLPEFPRDALPFIRAINSGATRMKL